MTWSYYVLSSRITPRVMGVLSMTSLRWFLQQRLQLLHLSIPPVVAGGLDELFGLGQAGVCLLFFIACQTQPRISQMAIRFVQAHAAALGNGEDLIQILPRLIQRAGSAAQFRARQ
jgi:hypothetical protein